MNLLGATILAVLGLIVLSAPRRWALIAMVAGVLYLTQAQQMTVFGFHIWAVRFLELAGFARVTIRHEFSFRQRNGIDGAFLLLYGFTTVVFVIRSTTGELDEIGKCVDAFLCYFTFRSLLRDIDDLRWFLNAFILLLAPYTLLVVVESITGHNPFTILNGMEGGGVWVRHGWPRCFSSFRQPDTLGMFAASFIPLYIGMICSSAEKKRASFAVFLCLIIVLASNSGGAAAAVAVGFVCWGFWSFRMKMRRVRWAILCMVFALALIMKAPVWFILAHFSSVTGGDAYHRSYLIDVAYRHLNQWWLAGMPISDTSDWFPYSLPTTGGADITNQFISYGLQAGLGSVALFIMLLARVFSSLGKTLSLFRNNTTSARESEFLLWGLGAMLVVHITDLFDITYFDQMYVVWFMQLAAISSISQAYLAGVVPAAEEEIAIQSEADSAQPVAGFHPPNLPQINTLFSPLPTQTERK